MHAQRAQLQPPGGSSPFVPMRPCPRAGAAAAPRRRLPCNTESDLDDVCAMTYLSEAAVLDCVRVRFYNKKIYTWVAQVVKWRRVFAWLIINIGLYGFDRVVGHLHGLGEQAAAAVHLLQQVFWVLVRL